MEVLLLNRDVRIKRYHAKCLIPVWPGYLLIKWWLLMVINLEAVIEFLLCASYCTDVKHSVILKLPKSKTKSYCSLGN